MNLSMMTPLQYMLTFFIALLAIYIIVRVIFFGIFQSWFNARKSYLQHLIKRKEKDSLCRKDAQENK